jgi:murein L,D-transpeptidase YafK
VRQGTRGDTVASFPVCAMNTSPGFKQEQGDTRTPDGIYRIPLLNPGSSYHLSMKMDYPNAVDNARHARHTRLAGRRWSQGGDIFIHGKCASVGCIAMTDEVIEKLYLLVASLPASRRQIPVLVLPYDSEAHYQQLFFHADSEYAETRDPYWLLLREHIGNMRDLWLHYRDTGSIPTVVATGDGHYALPDDTR